MPLHVVNAIKEEAILDTECNNVNKTMWVMSRM